MSFLTSKVWEQSGHDTITRSEFYLVLGAILTWGFIFTTIIANATSAWNPGLIELLVVSLGIPIAGILLSHRSSDPFISFIGFNMIVGGIAAGIGPTLAMYALEEPGLIAQTATLTALVAFIMGTSGFMFPNFYKSIGGILFGSLLALVIVSISSIFIPSLQGLGIINYVAVIIFALYIGYDMWRASRIPATLDNAVDVAVALYLDIINLFMHLLRILSGSRK